MLMLHRLSQTERDQGVIFFVVPFVSLAEEKAEYFRQIWSDLRVGVKLFHGDDSCLTDDVDVAVCTIEKANSLVNRLFDDGKQHMLRMVVIDEVRHYIMSIISFYIHCSLSLPPSVPFSPPLRIVHTFLFSLSQVHLLSDPSRG